MSQSTDFTPDEQATVHQKSGQAEILVFDSSGSMPEIAAGTMTKAQAVDVAVKEHIKRLILSKNKRDFSIALIRVDHLARIETSPTLVADDTGTS
jgi:hypothetical protein